MARQNEALSVREARLAEIRRAIANDTYETPERLSAAIDVLLVDLEGRKDCVDDGRGQPKVP